MKIRIHNTIEVTDAGQGHKKVTVTDADTPGTTYSATTSNTRLTDSYFDEDEARSSAARVALIRKVMLYNDIQYYEIV
jgi:hypothetical protein